MIITVVTARIHPDKVEVYEAACRDVVPKVRASEPGTLFYEIGKSRDEPNTYRIIEAYKDEAAMKIHSANKDLAAAFPALAECIAGEITIQVHDVL